MATGLEKLLDFNQPIDIPLLDEVSVAVIFLESVLPVHTKR